MRSGRTTGTTPIAREGSKTAQLTLTSDQIAVGYQGSAGLWIDRIGPVVSTVQIVLQ